MEFSLLIRTYKLWILAILIVTIPVTSMLTFFLIRVADANQPQTSVNQPIPSITDWYNVGLLFLQTAGTGIAVVLAWIAYTQTREISKEQQQQTEKIHQEQIQFAQNQAFIGLFEHLKNLREIPAAVNEWDDVINMVNLIEVIGVARAKNLIDEELLFVVYGNLVIKIYEQILAVKHASTGEQKGKEYLSDALGAIAIYRRWKKRIDDQEQVKIAKGQVKSNGTNP